MPECDALNDLRREGAAPFIFGGIDSDVFLAALRERAEQARAL
jgi:4-hydroxy-2-oxoheptanedioate aldolase